MRFIAFTLAGLGVTGLVGASLLTLLDVTLRYWGVSVLSLSEFVLLLITASAAAFFPLSLQQRRQLAINYLGRALGTPWRRALDVFGGLATLVFFAIIAWRLILYALDTLRYGETTPMAALPIYPAWMIAAVVFVIGALIQLCVLVWLCRHDDDLPESDAT